MSDSKKIILFPNAERDIGFEITRRVMGMLEKRNKRTAFCPVFEDGDAALARPSGIETAELAEELPDAEMIIAFGGDGTILYAARAAVDAGVPILGINLGGKGFLAELEEDEIGLIDSVATGEYRLENRMMLDVEVTRGGSPAYRDFALNDAVVKGINKVVDLMLFGDGQLISRFSGDGVVIATPTGSTAYSWAAGGPIVEEGAHNIIVTPICAHVLGVKSFVLVSDRRVSVELGDRTHNPVYISVDGGANVGLLDGDVVKVRKSGRYTRLVRLSNRSYYKKVSEKLGERS